MSQGGFVHEHLYDDENITKIHLPHFFLCGISSYALKAISFANHPMAYGISAFLFSHSLLGIFRFAHPSYEMERMRELHRISNILAKKALIALINAEISNCINDSDILNNWLGATSVAESLTRLSFPISSNYFSNFLMFTNSGYLIYAALKKNNYWAAGLGGFGLISLFVINPIAYQFNLSKSDLSIFRNSISLIFVILNAK